MESRLRRGPRAGVLAVVVVATASVWLVGADPGRAASEDPVRSLLDRRVEALTDGDLGAWMATVDPAAPPTFVEAQQRQFEGLTGVGVTDVELTVDPRYGDLAPPGTAERHGGEVVLPSTELSYRIEGYDDRAAVDQLWWTYVRRDGEWYVASADDLEVVGLSTQRRLWDLGAITTVRTDRVLVVSRADRSSRADDLARLVEEAIARFEQFWGTPWPGQIVAVAPSSADEVETILQTTLDLDNFVAFVQYTVDRDEGYETTAPRMYLNDERLAQRTRTFQLDTLVHELVHAATASDAGPFVDSWVHEGLAEWITDGRPTDLPVPDGSDGTIPSAFDFRTGGRERIARSYAEATSVMAHLAATRGSDAPIEFFSALGARRVVPGDGQYHVNDVLESLFDVSEVGLAEEWSP